MAKDKGGHGSSKKTLSDSHGGSAKHPRLNYESAGATRKNFGPRKGKMYGPGHRASK